MKYLTTYTKTAAILRLLNHFNEVMPFWFQKARLMKVIPVCWHAAGIVFYFINSSLFCYDLAYLSFFYFKKSFFKTKERDDWLVLSHNSSVCFAIGYPPAADSSVTTKDVQKTGSLCLHLAHSSSIFAQS